MNTQETLDFLAARYEEIPFYEAGGAEPLAVVILTAQEMSFGPDDAQVIEHCYTGWIRGATMGRRGMQYHVSVKTGPRSYMTVPVYRESVTFAKVESYGFGSKPKKG
jgi:hypothetical protein